MTVISSKENEQEEMSKAKIVLLEQAFFEDSVITTKHFTQNISYLIFKFKTSSTAKQL